MNVCNPEFLRQYQLKIQCPAATGLFREYSLVIIRRQLSTGSISFWLAPPITSGLTMASHVHRDLTGPPINSTCNSEIISNSMNRASFKNVFGGFKITSQALPRKLGYCSTGKLQSQQVNSSAWDTLASSGPLLALPADQVTPVRTVPLLPGGGELSSARSFRDLSESIHQLLQNVSSLLLGLVSCPLLHRVSLFQLSLPHKPGLLLAHQLARF